MLDLSHDIIQKSNPIKSKKILPKLGLSKRKKFPCLKLSTNPNALRFKQILKILRNNMGWRVIEEDNDQVVIHNKKYFFKTTPFRLGTLFIEWDTWKVDYKIPKDLNVKTIFDVGCDTGSTMLFFNNYYNVNRFILCDIDLDYVKLAKHNAELNNIDVLSTYSKPYQNEILNEAPDFDLMKMDIEGGEHELLKKDIDFPIVLEVHKENIKEKLLEKKFIITDKRESEEFGQVWLMNNFNWWV